MTEMKKYLDLAGLTHYDEKIKAYIKTNGSDVTDKLVALIGAAEKGADDKTILARIADLETAVGNVEQLPEEVANLVQAILGEAARAKDAEGKLQDAIDAEVERAEGAELGLSNRIKAIEDDYLVEADKTELEGKITDEVNDRIAAIEALDATVGSKTVAEGKHIAVEVVEEDGKLTGLTVTENDIASKSALEKLQAVVGYSELATEGQDAKSVKARLDVIEGAASVEGSIAKALKDAKDYTDAEKARAEKAESDLQDAIDAEETARKAHIGDLGKNGEVDHTVRSYVDTKVAEINGAADELEERVDALEATHATKEDGSLQTVAEEVATGIANLRDGADAAFDTLKEIANWINDSDANAEGFNAAKRITDLEKGLSDEVARAGRVEGGLQDAIDDEAKRADEAEKANKKAIEDETAAARAAEEQLGKDLAAEAKRAGDAEDALDARLDVLEGADTVVGSVAKAEKDAKAHATALVEALDNELTQEYSANNGLALSLTQVDGKVTALSGSINTIENSEIDALFANK